jgi:hypothetical protein
MTNIKKDPGLYPSDWKPPTTIQDIQKIFEAHNFFYGRMIGGSKSHYHQEHPLDLIVFNANVVIPEYGKVWYGDVSITIDGDTLKEIAECLDTTLYVCDEMSARFGNENRPVKELISDSIWNTDEPVMNLEQWIENRKKYE